MKKRIGIIEKDLRGSLEHYKKDKDLYALLKAIATQSDNHIHYYWQYKFFMYQLGRVFHELIQNSNPSHREGKVDATSSKREE